MADESSLYIQISTTVAGRKEAEQIAKVLLDKKLSACTQIIGPIVSLYRWQKKIAKTKEWLCVVKARRSEYKKIERTIREIHPYKLPEIIVTPIIKGSREYLGWLKRNT